MPLPSTASNSKKQRLERLREQARERFQSGQIYRVARHRDFRLLWSGAFLSFIGSWVQNIAQGYLVFQITKSEAALALVSALNMLPVTFFGLVAGGLTDTMNKRVLLVITQSVFAVAALYLAAGTYFGFVEYWHILVVALITGSVGAIEMPTRQSIVSRVVPPEDLPAAIPLNALTFNLARLVGPAIGGILLATLGVEACYLVNGLSYAALILAGLAIKADLSATAREPQPILDLVFEGARYTFRDIRLRTLFLLESSVSIFGLFYLPQIPAIAERMLGIGRADLSKAYLSVGIGSVIAIFTVTHLSGRPIKATVVRVMITFLGAALFALSFVHRPIIAYVLFACLGFSAVSLFSTINTLFQTLSPDRLRGRVLSMHVWALAGSAPFGVYGLGWIAEHFGLRVSLQVGGALVLITAAVAWIYRRGLKGVENVYEEPII